MYSFTLCVCVVSVILATHPNTHHLLHQCNRTFQDLPLPLWAWWQLPMVCLWAHYELLAGINWRCACIAQAVGWHFSMGKDSVCCKFMFCTETMESAFHFQGLIMCKHCQHHWPSIFFPKSDLNVKTASNVWVNKPLHKVAHSHLLKCTMDFTREITRTMTCVHKGHYLLTV